MIRKLILNFSIINYYFVCCYILVGNKNDDPQSKVVVTEDAQRFAQQMDIPLFETSAKENINVEDMFLAITEKVLRHKKQTQRLQNDQQNDRINLADTGRKKKKRCC